MLSNDIAPKFIRGILTELFDETELRTLCFDMNIEYDSLPGSGKADKARELVKHCQRHHRYDELVETCRELRPHAFENGRGCFGLTFVNRESEKRFIHDLLNKGTYIQVHAPGGLGKTYLLKEIQKELHAQGWTTVWIDFAAESHAASVADYYRFLHEFAQQALGHDAPDITTHDLSTALHLIGLGLANLDKVVFFLDNADRGDQRLLQWIRAEFLEQMSHWLPEQPIRMIASCHQVIPEWQGHTKGRPFQDVALSSFEDSGILRLIINDSVTRFGAKTVQTRQQKNDEAWSRYLQDMSDGLFHATRGHPLAIERVLRYALDKDRLMHPSFFADCHTNICTWCLAPLVGERILPKIDRVVREAFRSLCIFRYIWPGVIRTLINPDVPDTLGGVWAPFGSGEQSWEVWWSLLQDTHLVYRVTDRQMYPLSPVVRQVIALVLQSEDRALYQARHLRALREYERLVASPHIPLSQKSAYILEVLYHKTQAASIPGDASEIEHMFDTFLQTLSQSDERIDSTHRLHTWLREDMELREAVSQYASPAVYETVLAMVDEHIKK